MPRLKATATERSRIYGWGNFVAISDLCAQIFRVPWCTA